MRDHWPKDQVLVIVVHVSIIVVGLFVTATVPVFLRLLGE